MKKIQNRTKFCMVICAIFLVGLLIFFVKFYRNRNTWTIEKYYEAIGYNPVTNYDLIPIDANDKKRRSYYTDETNAEKLYVRGTLVDRNGLLLATVNENGISYNLNTNVRVAMTKVVGDRYKNISTGAIHALSSHFSRYITDGGEYAANDTGNEVRITVDSNLNQIAYQALGNYTGVIGVYNYKTGEVIVNASTPTYDPDNIPKDINENEIYRGVYFNSLYQSVFTPGSTMKTVTLEAAIDTVPNLFKEQFVCTGSMQYGHQVLNCTGIHGYQDIATAYANSCNCAFAQISAMVTRDTMLRNVNNGILTSSTTIDGTIHTAKGSFDIMQDDDFQFAWTCVGLHHNLVNPCALMMYLGSVANGGQAAIPTNLKEVKSPSGEILASTVTKSGVKAINSETASLMRNMMINNTVNHPDHYATARFNMMIGAKTGTTTREDGNMNGWFAGFIADERYPYAFVCYVERAGYGVAIPGGICATVLNAIYNNEQYMDASAPAPTPFAYHPPGWVPTPTPTPGDEPEGGPNAVPDDNADAGADE